MTLFVFYNILKLLVFLSMSTQNAIIPINHQSIKYRYTVTQLVGSFIISIIVTY